MIVTNRSGLLALVISFTLISSTVMIPAQGFAEHIWQDPVYDSEGNVVQPGGYYDSDTGEYVGTGEETPSEPQSYDSGYTSIDQPSDSTVSYGYPTVQDAQNAGAYGPQIIAGVPDTWVDYPNSTTDNTPSEQPSYSTVSYGYATVQDAQNAGAYGPQIIAGVPDTWVDYPDSTTDNTPSEQPSYSTVSYGYPTVQDAQNAGAYGPQIIAGVPDTWVDYPNYTNVQQQYGGRADGYGVESEALINEQANLYSAPATQGYESIEAAQQAGAYGPQIIAGAPDTWVDYPNYTNVQQQYGGRADGYGVESEALINEQANLYMDSQVEAAAALNPDLPVYYMLHPEEGVDVSALPTEENAKDAAKVLLNASALVATIATGGGAAAAAGIFGGEKALESYTLDNQTAVDSIQSGAATAAFTYVGGKAIEFASPYVVKGTKQLGSYLSDSAENLFAKSESLATENVVAASTGNATEAAENVAASTGNAAEQAGKNIPQFDLQLFAESTENAVNGEARTIAQEYAGPASENWMESLSAKYDTMFGTGSKAAEAGTKAANEVKNSAAPTAGSGVRETSEGVAIGSDTPIAVEAKGTDKSLLDSIIEKHDIPTEPTTFKTTNDTIVEISSDVKEGNTVYSGKYTYPNDTIVTFEYTPNKGSYATSFTSGIAKEVTNGTEIATGEAANGAKATAEGATNVTNISDDAIKEQVLKINNNGLYKGEYSIDGNNISYDVQLSQNGNKLITVNDETYLVDKNGVFQGLATKENIALAEATQPSTGLMDKIRNSIAPSEEITDYGAVAAEESSTGGLLDTMGSKAKQLISSTKDAMTNATNKASITKDSFKNLVNGSSEATDEAAYLEAFKGRFGTSNQDNVIDVALAELDAQKSELNLGNVGKAAGLVALAGTAAYATTDGIKIGIANSQQSLSTTTADSDPIITLDGSSFKIPQATTTQEVSTDKSNQTSSTQSTSNNNATQTPTTQGAANNKTTQTPNTQDTANNKTAQTPNIQGAANNKTTQTPNAQGTANNKTTQTPNAQGTANNKAAQTIVSIANNLNYTNPLTGKSYTDAQKKLIIAYLTGKINATQLHDATDLNGNRVFSVGTFSFISDPNNALAKAANEYFKGKVPDSILIKLLTAKSR